MKQITMFDMPDDTEKKYSATISAPIYEPKNKPPHLMILCDDSKTKRLIEKINETSLPELEKHFLRLAAQRHTVFHYERIADYYSHASKEMQAMMEESALVIIDFDDAIARGFVKLCDDIKTQYMEEYQDES